MFDMNAYGVCVCVLVGAYVCVQRPEDTLGYHSSLLPLFRKGLLLAAVYGRLAGPGTSALSCLLLLPPHCWALGSQTQAIVPGLNSGPHAYAGSTFHMPRQLSSPNHCCWRKLLDFWCLPYFRETVPLHRLSWPGIHCVAQAGFKLVSLRLLNAGIFKQVFPCPTDCLFFEAINTGTLKQSDFFFCITWI